MSRPSTFSPTPQSGNPVDEEEREEESVVKATSPIRTTKDGALNTSETTEARALRIALESRSRVGAPSSTREDGSVVPATGIWRVVEPMYTDWAAGKKRDAGIRGFVAKPVERIIDNLVVMLLGFLIALASQYVRCSGVQVAPTSRDATSK